MQPRAAACGLVALLALCAPLAACEETPPPIAELLDYQRDVQPILANHCFGCHGPDPSTRAAGLQLDTFEGATADRGGGQFAIAPGDPDRSLLLDRVARTDAARMPPAPARALSAEEIDTLRRWIAQGAPYGRHWAFEPIAQVDVPGSGHPVDAFVRARLAADGRDLSPRAEAATLLRRLSLDLRGVPPSLEELDAWLADPSERAYEEQLDTWLASPEHAERLALDWLDYTGYGDSNGLHADDPREAWPWRDWLIARFLENAPLDEMIVAQLAGDLLPGATEDDVLATGLLRLHATTGEGGVDPAERRFLHAMDRARLVGTQFFGLTVHCAQCHDHKYDPISQRDFYSLIACFDRVADHGLVSNLESEAPTLAVLSPLWPRERPALEARRVALEARLAEADVASAQRAWEARVTDVADFVPPRIVSAESAFGARVTVESPARVQLGGPVPVAETLTITLTHELPMRALRLELGSGRSALAPWLTEVTAERDTGAGRARITFAAAFFEDDGSDATALIDGANTSGFELPAPRSVVLVPSEPIDVSSGQLVLRLDQRHGASTVLGSVSIGVGTSESDVLSALLRAALATPEATRSVEQRAALRMMFAAVGEGSPARIEALEHERIRHALALGDTRVHTRVMREDDPDRTTHILSRGQWGQPAEPVRCAVPAALRIDHPIDVRDRLELARFIVGQDNPISSRVLANHYLTLLLGQSLVATPDDWGSRGGTPSDRALIDWLASTLRDSGWDLRAFLRRIALSETYRQSSHVTPEAMLLDPDNRALARAARPRLSAEMLRDQALAAAGLLTPALGGRPAFVPHPDGLYEALGEGLGAMTSYPVDREPRQQHRRALYTFWRRSAPHPSFLLFDAPDRMHAIARREQTSTPTQALALLHDPHFVEAARVLAARARATHPRDLDAQLTFMVRRVLLRTPSDAERSLLRAAYEAEREELALDPAAATALLRVGELDAPSDEPIDHAAATLVARALLSSSEAMTRE